MLPNDIDDLFRNQLNDHATPPGEDLWARLAAGLAAEKEVPAPADAAMDVAFRAGLGQHASPVRRELWERLEDEHLRPRQRRAAGFWPLALAASLALLLVGGAGWWLRTGGLRPAPVAKTEQTTRAHRAPAVATAATTGKPTTATAVAVAAAAVAPAPAAATTTPAASTGRAVATATGRPTTRNNFSAKNRSQRAALAVLAGSNGAAAGQLPKKPGGRATRAGQPASSGSVGKESAAALVAAARPAPAPAPQSAGTVALTPRPDAAGEARLAPASLPAPALASSAGTIEVEVRPGSVARPSQATAAAFGPADRRGSRAGRVLGGLLRQATNLVQGEPLNLADATGKGPSQTLLLQARVGSRTLSKSIQL